MAYLFRSPCTTREQYLPQELPAGDVPARRLESDMRAFVRNKRNDMRKQLSMLVMCGVMLLSSASVFAQSNGYGHDGNDHRDNHGKSAHDDHSRMQASRNPHYSGMHDRGLHEGWYKRGGRVPATYRSGHYVVSDWRSAHLRQPPRGYHWVRSDNGDYLMVAVATGIIAQILANH